MITKNKLNDLLKANKEWSEENQKLQEALRAMHEAINVELKELGVTLRSLRSSMINDETRYRDSAAGYALQYIERDDLGTLKSACRLNGRSQQVKDDRALIDKLVSIVETTSAKIATLG